MMRWIIKWAAFAFVGLITFGIPLAVVALSGCASSPYAEIGLGYQIDSMTDHWVQTTNKDQCSKQPQFHIELGLEWANDWTLGYHHQSWVRCGGPFNDRPEIYTDDIRLTKKWGGK